MTRWLHRLPPIELSRRDLTVVAEAVAQDGVLAGDGRRGRYRAVHEMSQRGIFVWMDHENTVGWERGMWASVLTANGWAAYERANELLQEHLDLEAFEALSRAQDVHSSGSNLWCVEHGYIPRSKWRTDKTCPFTGTCYHDRGLARV